LNDLFTILFADVNAEIITIGDEILIGQVVDTNSAYLATELNLLGISVIQITSVPDKADRIIKALDEAKTRARLVILTGGIGPTSDDITKQTLAKYFDSDLVENPAVLEQIQALLHTRGLTINERNKKQAELPDNCEILHNSAGTAQGMWFSQDSVIFVSLPGVPYEMKAIYSEELEPRLKERFKLPAIHHVTVLTHGVPESQMAGLIKDWEDSLPSDMKLAYLPSPGLLRLRISGQTTGNPEILKSRMDNEVEKLNEIIGTYIFGYNNDKLEEIVGKLLKDKKLTLSVAESCTGGMISGLITSVPGSSVYYKGGVVAYSNEIKIKFLDVSPYTLMMNGAVSQAIVEQMASGALQRFESDLAVAVTGIAGPTGGTAEKPVGTTWIAVASKKRIISSVYNFGEERGRNIQKAAIAALFMLRREIIDCL
jgi:nicotinamide-nucleotide amidase